MSTPAQKNNISQDAVAKKTSEFATQSHPDTRHLRVQVRGKFLFLGDEKYWIKGVTYGTFNPDGEGHQFPKPDVVESDFKAMSANGINTLRTYTPPPRWLLDEALKQGLKVMVGLAWEQHVAFLDDIDLTKKIKNNAREGAKTCAGHPALLCLTIGNEIPAPIVRWHGRKKIEHFLHRLYRIVKAVDPDALVTYVNYPTTEYLQLDFLDIYCFNVYLEEQQKLESYLARLQNLSNERPLLMAEIGLDSQRNGEQQQAESLDWQIRTAFTSGCAGAFVFAWTDEWYRGGNDIEDWDFGLTTRERQPKAALNAVREAFDDVPFSKDIHWPKISVVICSYNGSSTIRDTFEALKTLPYPDFEVIVVNDGSTDTTPDIAAEYDVRLISTKNRGLSNARNTGWQEANGEIIAYIDDDAYPDPHWLHYIAYTYLNGEFAGVGGPNLAPPGDGSIADCIANAPGGPVQVLLTDTIAEHVPGCNMTFRRDALEAIGGFDPRYRAAGDDVDVCWRIQQNVGKIGFHAAAMDWHHRRNSVKTYWKQQQGYGKAEALLEEKWPEKYNAMGHFSWSGRLYGNGLTEFLPLARSRIYGGPWGSALFQSIYQPSAGSWLSLPLMPEWYLLTLFLGLLVLFGLDWAPLLWVTPLLLLALVAPVVQATISAARAKFPTPRPDPVQRFRLRVLTAVLHLMQPLARLIGRLRHGLTPWRRRGLGVRALRFMPAKPTLWFEQWCEPAALIVDLVKELKEADLVAYQGGDYDDWDLVIRGGLFGYAHLNLAVEEHSDGKQLYRFRIRPRFAPWSLTVAGLLGVFAVLSAVDAAWLASVFTAALGVWLFAMALCESGAAVACAERVVRQFVTT